MMSDEEEQPAKADRPPLEHRSVLVVEDEPDYMHLVTIILERVNYRVLPALSGPAALALLADPQTPPLALVLCDLRMGEDDEGLQVCRAVQANPRYQAVPFVLMTGVPGAPNPTHASDDCRIAAVLRKPFTKVELLDLLDRLT